MIVSGGIVLLKKLLINYIDKVDFIIVVDKGSECFYSYNIIFDLFLGDFDLINKEILNSIKLKVGEVLEFLFEKDYMDIEIVIIEFFKRGVKKIYLFGVIGLRMDYILGNIGFLLIIKKKGVILEIIDDYNKIYLVEKNMKLYGKYGKNIFFYVLCDKVIKFEIKGVKYNLDLYDINLLDFRVICNEFVDILI